MNQYGKRPKRFFLFALIAIPFFCLLPLAVMLLWNYVLPSATGAGEIDYWRALGLLALSRILFGWPRGGWGRKGGGSWREKWSQMNDEERAKFKADWRRRCGQKEETPPAATEQQ